MAAITKPTANILLDTRRPLKSGKYPIKLTIYYLGQKVRYKLPIELSENEWEKINTSRLRDEALKEIKSKLDFYTGEKFEDCLKKIDDPFSFEKFEDIYFEKYKLVNRNLDVYTAYQNYIDEQEKSEKTSNASIYTTSKKSFQLFKSKLAFDDITPEFLESYERHMLASGKSVAYIAINLRNLKTIYNKAINAGLVKQENYPFKAFRIKKGNNIKKALTIEQLKVLKNHNTKTDAQQKALDFWLLSFYCNGINMIDICRLQYKNIISDQIVFVRKKSENSTVSSKTVRIAIIPEIRQIIDKYGNPNKEPDNYIFNILPHGIDAKRERDIVQSFTRNINKHMKAVSNDLSFGVTLSTYWARHSFATFLKRSGISIEVISEALGHTNIETTQNYLDTFTDETILNTGKILSSL
jgi:site-specific recombinase XerD